MSKKSIEKSEHKSRPRSTKPHQDKASVSQGHSQAHPPSKPPIQVLALSRTREEQDKWQLFAETLRQSGLWQALESAQQRAAIEKRDFTILIKPDFCAYSDAATTATDPSLVEYLIDLLHQQGYQQCIVGQTPDSSSLWLENRDVMVLADLLGYQFVTPEGRHYDIVDLAEQTVEGEFPEGSVMHGVPLSQLWVEADFRINFVKNKSHSSHYYALCLNGLLDTLPQADKARHYREQIRTWDAVAEIEKHYAADFSIIDAYISNHGMFGEKLSQAIQTETFIAGTNALLVDHVGARKMGLAPLASPIYRAVQRHLNESEPQDIDTDLDHYPNWVNVDELYIKANQKREQHGALDRLLLPWLQQVDNELFPFKDPVNAQVNHFLQKLFTRAEQEPGAYWLLIAANYLLVWLGEWLQSMQIMYWKDHVPREKVSLNIDPGDYSKEDFDSIEPYLKALAPQLDSIERDASGLRWTFLEDDSVVFDFVQILPINFDSFTREVDISQAIQMMNDYIGGLIIVVEEDEERRLAYQVERNLYLPQPNYIAFYQGKYIDVSKLEHIRRDENQHHMSWKTVFSENDSADYDDGYVSFTRDENNETRVCIFGRQKFALPPLLEFVNSEAYRPIRKFLTKHAYTTFFTTTLANFAAVYEGRDIRIGKPFLSPDSMAETAYETGSQLLMSLADRLKELLQIEDLGQLSAEASRGPARNAASHIDEDGFVHFKASSAQTQTGAKDGVVQSLLKQMQQSTLNYYRDLGKEIAKDLLQ